MNFFFREWPKIGFSGRFRHVIICDVTNRFFLNKSRYIQLFHWIQVSRSLWTYYTSFKQKSNALAQMDLVCFETAHILDLAVTCLSAHIVLFWVKNRSCFPLSSQICCWRSPKQSIFIHSFIHFRIFMAINCIVTSKWLVYSQIMES